MIDWPSPSVNGNRVTTRGACEGVRYTVAALASTPTTTAESTTGIVRRHSGCDGASAGTPRASPAAGAAGSSSTIRASPMSRSRRLTSRSRHRAIRRRTDAGVDAGSAVQSMSWRKTAASVSAMSSPLNARWPVSIS